MKKDIKDKVIVIPNNIDITVPKNYNKKGITKDFKLTLGKTITLKTQKAIEDVKLIFQRRLLNSDGKFNTFESEKKIKLTEKTFGPYDGNYEYKIKLSKSRFEFEIESSFDSIGNQIFDVTTVEKSVIQVNATDNDGNPIKGVQVYITSTERGKNFRAVSPTNSKGLMKQEIYKGQYLVKVVLKEYEITPTQKLVKIEEGETFKMDVKAIRTRFSAIGTGIAYNLIFSQ